GNRYTLNGRRKTQNQLRSSPLRLCISRLPSSLWAKPAAAKRLLRQRLHVREQNHVFNGVAVGKQHHQTIDTNPFTGGRRQAVFQRIHLVSIVVHGFVVTGVFFFHLFAEAFSLVFGVV